jgi:predicted RNA-binding protein with PIN domain
MLCCGLLRETCAKLARWRGSVAGTEPPAATGVAVTNEEGLGEPAGDMPGDANDDHLERLNAPLPEPVRSRVVALAADCLGMLAPEEIPASLRSFARFAPSRRAKLAATPIAAAIEVDQGFRKQVAERVRVALPDLVAALEQGTVPAAADPLDVAAVAYLHRPRRWPAFVAGAIEEVARASAAAESTQAAEAVSRLQEQLAAARAAARADADRLRRELEAVKKENTELRRKLKDARDRARLAESGVAAAEAAAAVTGAAAEAATNAADAELRRMRSRLADADSALEAARRSVREGRAAGDLRLRLLLDTLVDAAQGLRRELALPPAAGRPADSVQAIFPDAPGTGDVAARALAVDDPAVLDQLLALPQVHLVVDGYNVTKTGYGSLTLAEQRTRLLTGLAGLAARSGAEVTCVFDGAELSGPVPVAAPRGVRVLFSSAGETADDLIHRLVRAEPPGRPVVVVSADREIADATARAGARPVPATVLLRRLGRG